MRMHLLPRSRVLLAKAPRVVHNRATAHHQALYSKLFVCVCVCVCVRERESESWVFSCTKNFQSQALNTSKEATSPGFLLNKLSSTYCVMEAALRWTSCNEAVSTVTS